MPASIRQRGVSLVAATLLLAAGVAALAGLARDPQSTQQSEPLRVAAAISLREAFEAIAADFEKDTGVKVALTFGSSGQLLTQIRNGAPVDVFVSAAVDQMDVLEREDLIRVDSRRTVAGNRLVIIVPRKDAPAIARFEDLVRDDVKRVAIGEPATVPAGQYAEQVLEKLKLTDALRDRLVYGANVRQVLDYVARGEVSAGIVYETDAAADSTKVQIVATADASWHNPIIYPAAMLKAAHQPALAEKFLRSLGESRVVAILRKQGFSAPNSVPASQSAAGPAPSSAGRSAAPAGKP